jgi:hypothetical protein
MDSALSDDNPLPSWRQRPRPIGFEIAYRLDGAELEIDTTRKVERVKLAAVEQVRFLYAPSNVSTKGFKTQIRLFDGKVLSLGNLSWRSLTDMERDDAGYHAFVAALSAAIVRANPRARFVGGKPYPLWLAMAAVGGLSLAMLAYFSLRALSLGSSGVALLGVLLLAASFWQVWPMIRLNRPRDLGPGEVPDDLVPGRAG